MHRTTKPFPSTLDHLLLPLTMRVISELSCALNRGIVRVILTLTFGPAKTLVLVLTAAWPTLKSLHWTLCFSGPRHMLPGADDQAKLRISLVELLACVQLHRTLTLAPLLEIFFTTRETSSLWSGKEIAGYVCLLHH